MLTTMTWSYQVVQVMGVKGGALQAIPEPLAKMAYSRTLCVRTRNRLRPQRPHREQFRYTTNRLHCRTSLRPLEVRETIQDPFDLMKSAINQVIEGESSRA